MDDSIPQGPVRHRVGAQAPLVARGVLAAAVRARRRSLLSVDLHAFACISKQRERLRASLSVSGSDRQSRNDLGGNDEMSECRKDSHCFQWLSDNMCLVWLEVPRKFKKSTL